jgi:hypothetical protein
MPTTRSEPENAQEAAHQVLKELRDLVQLEHDLVEACDAAVPRLDDLDSKSLLQVYRSGHERHITDLNVVIVDKGGRPPLRADARRLLTEGRVFILGLRGDPGILRAMGANEEDGRKAYERVLARAGLWPDLARLLEHNLDDVLKYRAGLDQRLRTL